MAKYLLEVTYTLDGVRGLKSEGGTARVAAATEAIEGLGGKINGFYFAFGEIPMSLLSPTTPTTSLWLQRRSP